MNRHLRWLIVAAALTGVVGAAKAETENLIFLQSGPLGRYDLRLNGANMNDIHAGWLKFGVGSPSATDYLFCTEITQGIAPKGQFKEYQKIEKNGEIGWLINQYDKVVNSNLSDKDARAAGIQLAIWEVKYEGEGQASYDLDSGKFKVRDADNSLAVKGMSYAEKYLKDMKGNSANYYLYTNSKYQDMVGAAPVPEPATMAALAAGALFLRRRKKKA